MTDQELQQLKDQIQRLTDIEDIKQLKARYFEYADGQDWESYANEIVTEDFAFDSDAGLIEGRDEVIAMVSRSLLGATTVHHGHMPRIEIDGDTATGTWAMDDYVTIPLPDGDAYVIRGYGHYHETYRRTPDGWRISSSRMARIRVDSEGADFVMADTES
jgi:hypothetical protein